MILNFNEIKNFYFKEYVAHHVWHNLMNKSDLVKDKLLVYEYIYSVFNNIRNLIEHNGAQNLLKYWWYKELAHIPPIPCKFPMIESERHGEKFYKSLGLFMDGIMLINHWKKVQLETFENIFPRITSEIETVGYNYYLSNRVENSTESLLHAKFYYEVIKLVNGYFEKLSDDFIFAEIIGENPFISNLRKNVRLYQNDIKLNITFEKLISDLQSYGSLNNPFGLLDYDSRLVAAWDLSWGEKRLLECDNPVLAPIGVPIRFLTTSLDVLHSWSIPACGIKMDAVPGRLNELVVVIEAPGIFFGQCSELCGYNHGFMPIKLIAVPINVFV
jgi:heme/copper-type cytochrome/quinol oxidase subunit 2